MPLALGHVLLGRSNRDDCAGNADGRRKCLVNIYEHLVNLYEYL